VRHQRLAAVASLVLFGASVVLAVVVAVERFPRGLSVLACVVVAAAAAWWALVRRGSARVAGALVAAVFLVGAIVLVVLEGGVLEDALILAGLVVSVAAASRAFVVRAQLPAASPPSRPVLFYNPKSGGGKAERFHVADEARARGVEPIELHLGDDLGALVRDAIAGGADAVGVAGGDGTQAIVAAIAAEQGLPYVCVPAGTRNHFALDLGVDRDDVVGALDAFTKARERVVDLAEVNGRVFVNNVGRSPADRSSPHTGRAHGSAPVPAAAPGPTSAAPQGPRRRARAGASLDLEVLIEIDQPAARKHRADRVDHLDRQVREVPEVLVLDLPALAVGAPQQVGRVLRPALALRLNCGYVRLAAAPRHSQ
jgi:hypothetical protein